MEKEARRDYGVLACHCGQYPVVGGIPVIRKGVVGSLGESVDKVVELVRAGDFRDALLTLSRPPIDSLIRTRSAATRRRPPGSRLLHRLNLRNKARKWDETADHLLRLDPREISAAQLIELYVSKQRKDTLDYFVYRFGQPRHLISLSLATIIPGSDRPVLDLGCGFGHLTRGIQQITDRPVVGVDNCFYSMYAASLKIAPDAFYVCCDANIALPFADDAFSATTCTNSFHFIANKLNCIRDLERVTHDDGPIILTSLRHSRVKAATRNIALPIKGYRDLMGNLPHRILSDAHILERYLAKRGPDLSQQIPKNLLSNEPFVSVVASRNTDIFRSYGALEEHCHARPNLRLNPLYKLEVLEDNRIRLVRTFPSKFFLDENRECESYLPEELVFETGVLDALKEGIRNREIDQLIDQVVVLDMPENYL